MGLRSAYVRSVRAARVVARRTGALQTFETSSRPSLRHLRTMFAVYDVEDLASLDLPWWSYGAIDEVERFLRERPQARVFEFGSGASTLWLAKRSGSVDTVEHDVDFAEVVRELIAGVDNVTLHVVEAPSVQAGRPTVRSERQGSEDLDFDDYVSTIEQVGGRFDLVVIDGRARVECLRRALPHVAADGVILFDDAERPRYADALRMPGLSVQVRRGAKPCLPYRSSTALLRPAGG